MARFNPEAEQSESEDIDDPTVALLSAMLLVMTCAKCSGTGKVGSKRCECRDAGYSIAVDCLRAEGLSS